MTTISRNSPCPCGSGKKYKSCHGSVEPTITTKDNTESSHLLNSGFYSKNLTSPELQHLCADQPLGQVISAGNIPPGFLLIQNFLSSSQCKKLIASVDRQTSIQARVQDPSDNNKTTVSEHRNNEISNLGQDTGLINDLFKALFRNQVKEYYGKPLAHFEKPQCLKYSAGGHYQFHADSENWNSELKCWQKHINRDVSLLLYLNDDFTGGEIVFPNFNFKLKPQQGMLLCFPSDHRYVHKAEKTLSGKRYVIVSWAAFASSRFKQNNLVEILKV